ncbi:MAG: lysylphosphatidylglycerol synthase transmembrane domain-containing protein [Aquihabitans sp.]
MAAVTQVEGIDLTSEEGGDDDDLMSGPKWSRHPTDMLRLGVFSLALAVAVALSLLNATQVRSISGDVVRLVSQLPRWIRDLILGATQMYIVVLSVVLLVVLARRSRRLLLLAMAASGAAALVMAGMQGWLDRAVPNRVVAVSLQPSWFIGAAFPSGTYLAAFTAGAIVLGSSLTQGWRRVVNASIGVAVAVRLLTAVAAPLNLAVTLCLGLVAGSLALAIAGSPRRPSSRRMVLDGLASAGFPAIHIEAAEVGSSHARTFLATTASGRRAFVKLIGRDERDAYRILRLMKSLRVKGLEDLRPNWSVEEQVNHEALTAMLARRRGVTAPDVLASGVTDTEAGFLVSATQQGWRLCDLPPEIVTDELIDEIWRQVTLLREQGIAHRWLTATQILVDVPGVTDRPRWEPAPSQTTVTVDDLDHTMIGLAEPVVAIIDFRWSVNQAEGHQLAADLAMLTASFALIVGAERAVDGAARAFGPGALAEALPLLQPLAMPDDLRSALAAQTEDVLPDVRSRMQAAAGGVPYELADIQRIKPGQILGLFGVAILAYSLLSFATSWRQISMALSSVSLWALPELAILAFIPFFAGAGMLIAVVPRPLPFPEVSRLMVAQSFLNRFTPANAGGMALRVRYLQKRGVDIGGAAAAVALTSVAAGIGQMVVLATFAAWAGSTGNVDFTLPEASTVAIAMLVGSVAAGLVWLTPWGRRVIAEHVLTTVRQVWSTIGELVARPSRFVALFAITIVGKLASIITFTETARALDVSIAFPKLGLLYLTAATLASAAPSPGGVGAVEAGLAAALTGVGVPITDALSVVFLFRLMTYWLPVPVSYVALRSLRGAVLE